MCLSPGRTHETKEGLRLHRIHTTFPELHLHLISCVCWASIKEYYILPFKVLILVQCKHKFFLLSIFLPCKMFRLNILSLVRNSDENIQHILLLYITRREKWWWRVQTTHWWCGQSHAMHVLFVIRFHRHCSKFCRSTSIDQKCRQNEQTLIWKKFLTDIDSWFSWFIHSFIENVSHSFHAVSNTEYLCFLCVWWWISFIFSRMNAFFSFCIIIIEWLMFQVNAWKKVKQSYNYSFILECFSISSTKSVEQ